jgi:hypothetical protein
MSEQLSFALGPACKTRGCAEPVVGSSIAGNGHVCRRHNEIEWGHALLSAGERLRPRGARRAPQGSMSAHYAYLGTVLLAEANERPQTRPERALDAVLAKVARVADG